MRLIVVRQGGARGSPLPADGRVWPAADRRVWPAADGRTWRAAWASRRRDYPGVRGGQPPPCGVDPDERQHLEGSPPSAALSHFPDVFLHSRAGSLANLARIPLFRVCGDVCHENPRAGPARFGRMIQKERRNGD